MLTGKSILLIVALSWLCGLSQVFGADHEVGKIKSPFDSIELRKLPNGIRIYLAPVPSAETMTLEVIAHIGSGSDPDDKKGMAHLVEHLLFTDPDISNERSIMRSKFSEGLYFHGLTSSDKTSYIAIAPESRGLETAERMSVRIVDRTFDAATIDFEKKIVLVEINQRTDPKDFINQFLGWFYLPAIFPTAISHTPSFTTADVQNFYDRNYVSTNLSVYVSGAFDREKMFATLQRHFGKVPANYDVPNRPVVQSPESQKQFHVKYGTPIFEIGSDVIGMSAVEQISVETYLYFLSGEYFDRLRLDNGAAYSVTPETDYTSPEKNKFKLTFSLSPVGYSDVIAEILERVRTDAFGDKLTREQFISAKRAMLNWYSVHELSSVNQVYQAKELGKFHRLFGEQRTPSQVLHELTFEQYKESLKKAFSARRRIVNSEAPPLFFSFDWLLLPILFFFAGIPLSRKFFLKSFPKNEIRYRMRITVSSTPIVLGVLCLVGCGAAAVVFALTDMIWYVVGFNEINVFVSDYIHWSLAAFFAATAFQAYVANAAMKLYVTEDSLWLKSVGYYSSRLKLSEIKSVETISTLQILSSPKMIYKLLIRYHCYEYFSVWKKGILLKTQKGSMIFLMTANVERDAAELTRYVTDANESGVILPVGLRKVG